MKHKATAILISAAFLLAVNSATGQISITSGAGLSYSQDFNTLTTNTTAQTWTDNTATTSALDSPQVIGIVGWYLQTFSTSAATTTNGFNSIRGGTGSSSTGSYYSFGAAGDPERALGTLPSDSITSAGAGALRIGARFVNNTGVTITGFTFSYDGEEWRAGGVTPSPVNNSYVASYASFAPGAGTLANSTYVSTLATFNTPDDGVGDATSHTLDGNNAANRIAGLTDTITGLSVAPGDEIWLRWSDANSTSADHGMGIDNFSVTFVVPAVPEPTFVALLGMGMGLLWYQVLRRKG